jgi:uncharacterized membrane protein
VASSLFVVPMLWVLGAIGASQVTLRIDDAIDRDFTDLPLGMASTVESARSVLSTVAGATITVAGIAFSIALLVLQQSSSQYSPRVVQGLFRDPFNKRVVGLEVGTFTFCLVVLRSVRTSLEGGGDPVVPNVSVAVAVLLGIASILGIVAFINHNAHTMEVSQILATVTDQTVEALDATWPEPGQEARTGSAEVASPSGLLDAAPPTAHVVRSATSGWVRYVDHGAVAAALRAGTRARLELTPGEFAVRGRPLCTVWPRPTEPDDFDRVVERAVRRGSTRTMAQDPSYGIRQLADVALRALSPGINDPTTAEDAIRHLTAVLAEAYDRVPPPRVCVGEDGGSLEMPSMPGYVELTELAFAEIRRIVSDHPRIAGVLVESQGELHALAGERELDEVARHLRAQARLTLDACHRASWLPEDLVALDVAHARAFGAIAAPARTEGHQ